MNLSLPRRVVRTWPLAEELVRVRAQFRGVPSPAAMVDLQRAAHRAEGIPGLAAQAMAGYTLTPLAGPPEPGSEVAAGGRRGRTTGAGLVTSSGWRDPCISLDLRVLTPLLAAGFRVGGSHLAFVCDLIRDLAADAAADADADRARSNALAVAAAFDQVGAPTRLEVQSAPGAPELVVGATSSAAATDTPPGQVVDQVATMLLGGRLVHGRIGAVTGAEPGRTPVALWEVTRRISPACLAFVADLLDAGRRGAADDPALVTAGVTIGLPRTPLATNVAHLVELLEPLARRLPADGPLSPSDEVGQGVLAVPDGLGVLYALSDLLAMRHVAAGLS